MAGLLRGKGGSINNDGGKLDEMRREFRDVDARLWTVFESLIPLNEWTAADHDTHKAGYGIGWLCFDTANEWRHLRIYPRQWWKLNDDALLRLWRQSRDAVGREQLGRPVS